MSINRRQLIKAGAAGGVLLTTGLPQISLGATKPSPQKSLSLLVLGGTGFIGPHMVREALRRGHEVTLFNRGRTNNMLFPDLETIKGDRGGDLAGLKKRRWDCVVDNSGYIPRHVQNSAKLLQPMVDHYLFISTVSVYESFIRPNDETSPLATMEDESIEEVNGQTYGPLKVLCEKRAASEMGERLTILRPTYICGPGDHTDRFTWYPVRCSRGGEMIWPGSPKHEIQIIDVRDLANFVVDALEQKILGTYNMVTPKRAYNFGQFLEDSQAVTASDMQPVWLDDEFLTSQQAASLFPIYAPATGEAARLFEISGERARGVGLKNRPIRETIRDLMTWWSTRSDERVQNARFRLTAEKEAELIQTWREANG